MQVGNIVKGIPERMSIPSAPRRENLLAHKIGMSSSVSDTIELWDPIDVCGMIVKIDTDISGYGPKLVQVLLSRRTLWFLASDLEVVLSPTVKQAK